MGVPDTTTFTLQNVVDEIDNDDNLVGCFNDAIASYFDSNYGPGDESNLLQFRNYGLQNSLTAFFSGPGQSDAKFLCSQALDRVRYHNGSGTYPVTGDTVYNNLTGQATQNFNYSSGNGIGGTILGYYTITGGNGVVSGSGPCNP